MGGEIGVAYSTWGRIRLLYKFRNIPLIYIGEGPKYDTQVSVCCVDFRCDMVSKD